MEFCGDGCVSFTLSYILNYIDSIDQLIKASLLLYEYDSSKNWDTFITSRARYELYSMNRHGLRHQSPISHLNITSPVYYRKGWRGFNICQQIKLMERRTRRRVKSGHDPMYFKGYKTTTSPYLGEGTVRTPISNNGTALLMLEYTRTSQVADMTERPRRSFAVANNILGTDTPCDDAFNFSSQPCCVAERTINLDEYSEPVGTIFATPRSFTLKFCSGVCGG